MIDERAISDAAHRLAAAAGSPARVLIFGSAARGEAGSHSDLDFLVVEESVDSKLREMVKLRDAIGDLDVPVDIILVTRDEAELKRHRPGSVVKRALAEGRVLVEP